MEAGCRLGRDVVQKGRAGDGGPQRKMPRRDGTEFAGMGTDWAGPTRCRDKIARRFVAARRLEGCPGGVFVHLQASD